MSRAPGAAFGTACAAPHVALHLDPHGVVRACCENKHHVLGNVIDSSILDIWRGPELDRLRTALRHDDVGLGCEGCERAIVTGERSTARVGVYDHERIADPAPPRPVRLELELSNRCNLQCVMCNGDLSSAIRIHREGRPALPRVYTDRFFEELGDLVPGLTHVAFLGGEPFLGDEPRRVFDLLIERGFTGTCHVTTNGTVVGDRVERILDSLHVDVSISVDGTTAATVEAIRVGVDHERLRRNVEWFRDKAVQRHTTLGLHYCLMRSNWFELRDFLVEADQLDVDVTVIPVRHPLSMTLDRVDEDERSHVLAELLAQDAAGPTLGRNLPAWEHTLHRLSTTESIVRLDSSEISHRRREDRRTLDAWADPDARATLEVDESERLIGATPSPTNVLGMDVVDQIGGHTAGLRTLLAERFGALRNSVVLPAPAGSELREFEYEDATGVTVVRVLMTPGPAGEHGVWELGSRRRSRA